MSRKRVLIVVNYFYPYISGVSEYARAVAANLAKYHEVTVLTGKHIAGLPYKEQCDDGYELIRVQPLLFLDKGYISPAFVSTFKRLAKRSDVVNLHLPMLESGLLALLTSRPLLVTYQCDMAIIGNPLSRLAVMGVRMSMRVAVARAKKVVVLSKEYASSSRIVRDCGQKLVEIAPPNRFEGEEIGKPESMEEDIMLCGFVGRFVLEKGIETIVRAARQLKGEPFVFWLAGDYENVAGGSVIAKLRDEIDSLGGQIQLLGRLSNEELIGFYRTIDTLLLPSTNRFEAFGMVQMEAMTFGATVVTSDMPGVRETVSKTKIGQLCQPGSAISLAKAIRRAQVERERISREEVRKAVHREFGNSKFVDSYLKLVDELSSS